MSLSDAVGYYGWQVTVWLAVGGLAVIAAFAVGLAIGRQVGRLETPHVAKRALERSTLAVVRWRERWRSEKALRERAEERHAILRGAAKAYETALEEAV